MQSVFRLSDQDLLAELDRIEHDVARTISRSRSLAADGRVDLQPSAALAELLARKQHVLHELRRRRPPTGSRPVLETLADSSDDVSLSEQDGVDLSHLAPEEMVADAVRQIGDAADLAEAAARVVKLAVEWSGAAWAEVVEPPGERKFRILAASDVTLAEAMYGSRLLTEQNPPLPDLRPATDRIIIEDLATDGRWASLTEVAATVPVRSAVLESLVVEGRYCAGMAVYDPRASYFGPERLHAVRLLATIAAPLLAGAAAHERARHLTTALASNRTIAAAVGILMYSSRLDRQSAFAELVVRSQHANRKVRDVAADIVESTSTSTSSRLAPYRLVRESGGPD